MGKQNREVAQDQPAILYLNNMCYSRIKSQESKDSSGGEELMCAWKEIVVPVSRSVNCHHVIRAAKQQMPKLHTNMLCKASCRSSAQVAKGASSSQAQGAVNGSSAATRLQVAKVHLGHTTYTQCSWSCLPRSSTTTRQQETSRELGHHAPTSIIILLYRQCSICSNDVDTVGPAHSKSIYGRPALQGKDDLMNHVHFLANPNGGCGFVIDIFWYIMHAIFLPHHGVAIMATASFEEFIHACVSLCCNQPVKYLSLAL